MLTNEKANPNPASPSAEQYNPILSIADVSEMKMALQEMFYAYVWSCAGRSEADHQKICFIYHGIMGMLDNEPDEVH